MLAYIPYMDPMGYINLWKYMVNDGYGVFWERSHDGLTKIGREIWNSMVFKNLGD